MQCGVCFPMHQLREHIKQCSSFSHLDHNPMTHDQSSPSYPAESPVQQTHDQSSPSYPPAPVQQTHDQSGPSYPAAPPVQQTCDHSFREMPHVQHTLQDYFTVYIKCRPFKVYTLMYNSSIHKSLNNHRKILLHHLLHTHPFHQ